MIFRYTKTVVKLRNRDNEDIIRILRLRNIKPKNGSFNILKKQYDSVSSEFWK